MYHAVVVGERHPNTEIFLSDHLEHRVTGVTYKDGHFSVQQTEHGINSKFIDVVALAAASLTKVETGQILHLHEDTVQRHRATAMRELGAASLGHAIAIAFQSGIFTIQRRIPIERTGLLTERQAQVLFLTSCGLSQDEIAPVIGIKFSSVKTHLHNSRDRLPRIPTEAGLVGYGYLTRYLPRIAIPTGGLARPIPVPVSEQLNTDELRQLCERQPLELTPRELPEARGLVSRRFAATAA